MKLSPAFLKVASPLARRSRHHRRVHLLHADIHHLPLAENTLDLVWCAHGLYTLPDPVDALRRMARVVRPGGHVAVFENDESYHVLLPWPVEIELALKKAELLAFVETSNRPRKYYVGRDLRRVFQLAGLARCTVRSVAFTRQALLDPSTRSFLEGYLEDLRRRAGPHLEPSLCLG